MSWEGQDWTEQIYYCNSPELGHLTYCLLPTQFLYNLHQSSYYSIEVRSQNKECNKLVYPLSLHWTTAMRGALFLCLLPLVLGAITDPVDLTKYFDENTVYWAGFKKFNHTQTKEGNVNGYWEATREFEASEHGGTHMDAPYHFNKKGWRIGDIPFHRFFGKGKTNYIFYSIIQ